MAHPIRIGNQTAISCATVMEPFEFALARGFDAFEWFADKKWRPDGTSIGWHEPDLDAATRLWIRQTGADRDVRYTVHAPWQANPLHPDGLALLARSVDFARDIGSDLMNLHLYMDDGPQGYAEALRPLLVHAATAGVRISIENTPHTTPDDFNRTFACLGSVAHNGSVGMCLDIGHANLCSATHNDYIRFFDALSPAVPLIHMHVHENYGDADTHLPLFTGPARRDDSGIRALLERLRQRQYQGVLIMEQWPRPPELLVEAAERLRGMLAEQEG